MELWTCLESLPALDLILVRDICLENHPFHLDFLVLLVYTLMSSANSDTFISSLPICISSISFCCFIVLVSTSPSQNN